MEREPENLRPRETSDIRAAAEQYLPVSHVVFHILASLASGEKHGYGIIKDVEERSAGRLTLEAGTLYAAIKRLRDDGLIEQRSAPRGTDERRRYYGLEPLGYGVLRAEAERLADLVEVARELRLLPPVSPGRV